MSENIICESCGGYCSSAETEQHRCYGCSKLICHPCVVVFGHDLSGDHKLGDWIQRVQWLEDQHEELESALLASIAREAELRKVASKLFAAAAELHGHMPCPDCIDWTEYGQIACPMMDIADGILGRAKETA